MSSRAPGSLADLVKAFPETSYAYETWAECERLLPDVLAALDRAATEKVVDEDVATLLERAAYYLQARQEIERARPLFERLVDVQTTLHGGDDLARADALRDLGELLAGVNDLDRASGYLAEALDIYERSDEPSGWNAISTRIALMELVPRLIARAADTQRALGMQDEASALVRQTREAMLAFLHKELERDLDIGALTTLARACVEHRALDLARQAIARAHQEFEDRGEPWDERESLGMGWHDLGDGYRDDDQSDYALAAYETAHLLLEDDPALLYDMATLQRDRDEIDAAVDLYRRSIDVQRASSRPRDLALSLLGLSIVEMTRDEIATGHGLALEALDLLPRDPDDQPALTGTALVLAGRGDIARNDLETAIARLEEGLGLLTDSGQNPDVVRSATGWLIAAYGKGGHDSKARKLLDEVALGEESALALAIVAGTCTEGGALDIAEAALVSAARSLDRADDEAGEALGAAWRQLAFARLMAGEHAGALRAYKATPPARDPDERGELVVGLIGIAMSASRASEVATAAEASQLAREVTRDDDPHHFAMASSVAAEVALAGGRPTEAVTVLEDADHALAELSWSDPMSASLKITVRSFLARAYGAASRPDDATETVRHLDENALAFLTTQSEPVGADFVTNLAHLLANTGALGAAREAADRALTEHAAAGTSGADSALPSALNAIGQGYYAAGSYAEALQAHQHSLELLMARAERDPVEEASTLQLIGNALHAQARSDEAADAYRQAVELHRTVDADDPERAQALARALTGVAIIDLSRGADDRQEAVAALEEALALLAEASDEPHGDLEQVEELLSQARA